MPRTFVSTVAWRKRLGKLCVKKKNLTLAKKRTKTETRSYYVVQRCLRAKDFPSLYREISCLYLIRSLYLHYVKLMIRSPIRHFLMLGKDIIP